MIIYFAPMEGITDGILRRVHNQIFGGIDIYCLPFHKLTQSMTLLTREKRDISPEENQGLRVLPQALTRDPEQLAAWLDDAEARARASRALDAVMARLHSDGDALGLAAREIREVVHAH